MIVYLNACPKILDAQVRAELAEICPAIRILEYSIKQLLVAGSFENYDLKDAVLEHEGLSATYALDPQSFLG